MKIAIDLTSLSYHITGIERYALNVTEAMVKNNTHNEYILIFKGEIYKDFKKYVEQKRIKAKIIDCKSKLLLFQLVLPLELYKIKADRYLFLAFPGPILFRKKGIYSAIHDMGAWDIPEAFKLFQRIYARATIIFGAINAQGIITVSEFSKERICKILRCKNEKIHVVYSGVTHKIKESKVVFGEIKKKYKLPNKYILALSTLEPKKNLEFLIESFVNVSSKVNFDLVLVGRIGWKVDSLLNRIAGENRICMTGFVNDNEISEIYRNAMCFVFPSKYEGFGLPPIEALEMGTPVIASNIASIPEILGEQAVYFSVDNGKELESVLINLEKNVDKMPCELSEKQKRLYSFETAARVILSIIE